MPILLTTFGLLLTLALVGVSQVTNTKNAVLFTGAITEQFDGFRLELQRALKIQATKLDSKNRPKTDKDPFSPQAEDERVEEATTPDHEQSEEEEKNSKEKTPRRTSFLHVDSLFCDDNPNLLEGKAKAAFLVLQAYLEELYKGHDFYDLAKEENPNLEQHLIKIWIKEAADQRQASPKYGKLRSAKDLAKLSLSESSLKYLRANIFNGTSPRKEPRRRGKVVYDSIGYYSLSDCLSIKPSEQILSIWLAPRPLLMALFQNEDTVNDVLLWRRDAYHEIAKNKSKATIDNYSKDCKSRFASSIALPIDPQFIDFNVSHNRVALSNT